MYLPSQSEPVQRTLVGRPFVNGAQYDAAGEQGMRASEYGVQPSGYGVQPSDFPWQSLIPIATSILGSI